MKPEKVAIIGGGICGLYLGWKLSQKGHKVVIFEKEKEVGNKVCSGLFSERILEYIPSSQRLIENRISSVLLNFPKKSIRVSFSKKFLVMNRSQLDRLVFDLAKGVEIVFNSNISSLPQGFDRIIGCDGANSFIRKELGLSDPLFRLAIQGFIRKEDFSDSVETWPCKDGFVWKIPRGKEIEYGVIGDIRKAKRTFDGFLEKNNLSLERIGSKIVPQGFLIPKNRKITLCGDAAGLTKPWSGGGVVWSLIAANILLKTFPDFLEYRRLMKRFFVPKIIFSKTVTRLVYFLGFNLPWFLPKNSKMESDFLL